MAHRAGGVILFGAAHLTPPSACDADTSPFEWGGGLASALLSLRGVQTNIGRYHILHGVEFDAAEGGLTMLLGRNGAGKTTTLRTIMGMWRAARGRDPLRRAGHHAPGDAGHRAAGYRLCAESMAIFADLTVQENLVLAARSGPPDQKRLDWIFTRFEAPAVLDPAGGTSCPAARSRCSRWRAIIEPRRLLLIDEPTKGLAPAIIANMIDAFRELKDGESTRWWSNRTSPRPPARRPGRSDGRRQGGAPGRHGGLCRGPALQQHLLGLGMDTHQ